ncbi:hypothetical protein H6F73_11455 [Microcoleus sp. FACHB-68]|nr:hypothetical protein [Microcoleus sp. FACHB-68]
MRIFVKLRRESGDFDGVGTQALDRCPCNFNSSALYLHEILPYTKVISSNLNKNRYYCIFYEIFGF